MIAFVKGILEDLYENRAIIDVNGIGYNVNISPSTASRLPGVDNDVKLYTYTSVREDAISLYGFVSMDELNLFKKLISVSNVGPKAGLSILSIGDSDDIKYAILSGDYKFISKAPGVGSKTAERIVLELKDKLTWSEKYISKEIDGGLNNKNAGGFISDNEMIKQAVAALVALGFSSAEAQKTVKTLEIDDNMSVEDILKLALSSMY